jgi:hypothetical protein
MRFTHEGTEYLIEFERTSKVRPAYVQGGSKTTVQTTAKVFKVTGPAKTDRELVREASATHYWKDRFSYESGRKAALAKAIYDAPTMKGGEPLMGKRLTKEFRTSLWTAYHSRPGGTLS